MSKRLEFSDEAIDRIAAFLRATQSAPEASDDE